MKSIAFVALIASLSMPALAKEKMVVRVVDHQDSNIPYQYAYVSSTYGVGGSMNLAGATLTLQLPDGRVAVVNCRSKFQERFAGPGNVRSCRVPLVDQLDVELDGDNAKLFWNVSIDGKKIQSETYKIIAVYNTPARASAASSSK